MKLHKSEDQAEALDLMRKKVNNELSCLKEKTKEELNLWSGLTTKFVMIKAFSDHLANTVELIEKQSQEAERSKSLLEGTMSEQLIFLSRATLEISDFSADLSYSEHERALCALHHGKLRDELKDLEGCLAQAVREAADMAKYKEMIEGQLIAAKEISNRDEAMLLRIQESLLSNPEEAEHHCQSERLHSERSSTIVEKQNLQVGDQLQAIKTSLQSQVEEHTSYATYLEHSLASRREVTEDKLDVLQEVLQATQQKSVQASLEIQTLNRVIESLKEQDDESAALVANLRQEVAEGKDAFNKNIEEMTHQKALEAVEVQNLNELIRTLKDQNDESAALVANLREEVAKAKDTLHKQVEETVQRKAVEVAEFKNLNEMMGTLRDQNDESAALVASLKQELAEAKDTLNKQVEETAQRMAVEAAEVHNLNEAIRILEEQNIESAAFAQNAAECCANLRQELVEAKSALDKQLEESAQRMALEAAEVHNLNAVIRILKEQNAESAELAQNTTEHCANLKQELVEAKDALDKQVEESAQHMAANTAEVHNLNEVIGILKNQNAESAELVASLSQKVAEAKDTLNKQVEDSAQRMAVDAAEVYSLSEAIRILKEQNAESTALAQNAAECCAKLRQELVEAKSALDQRVEESAQQMAAKTAEVHNLNEVIRILIQQNAESAELMAILRQEVAEAKETLNKRVKETAQQKDLEAAEVRNLNEVITTLKDQNDESAELVASLRQKVAEAKDTLTKQVEETAQRIAVDAAKSAELAQNAAECCAKLRQELVEAKCVLDKQVEESAQQMAVKTAEVHNLNEVIRILEQQNAESAELVARLRQVAEAKTSLNKQVEETAQRMALEAAEVQSLNEMIRALKEQNAESAELVQNAAECCTYLRQDLIEAKNALDKQVEESAQRMAVKTAEVQNLNEVIRALKKQDAESAELVVNLRQEVAGFQDTLNKQVEETAHQKALGTAQVHYLNELIRALKEQNDESAALVGKLNLELAEAEDALSQEVHEAAHRNGVEATEVQKLNAVIRTLKEQNVEDVALIARLRQEVAEAQNSLNKKAHQTAQQKAVKVQNLNQVIRTLKKQNAESAELVASLRQEVASLRQEVAEAKDARYKQTEEIAQRIAVGTAEVLNLNEVIRALKEQNAECGELVPILRQEVAEAQDSLNKQVQETIQWKTVDAVKVQNLSDTIKILKGQNEESAVLVAGLRQEVTEAKGDLIKQVEEAAQRKAVEAIEVQKLYEVIRILKEQNAESSMLVASLRQEMAEAQDSLNKHVQEATQWKAVEAVEFQNLNETIKILKGHNDESAVLVVSLRQEVTEAKGDLIKQVEEAAQREAVEAVEVKNLHELIGVLKEQNAESSALVVNLRQEMAEAKENINKEPEEMEVEFCRSLVDDSHRTFKDLADLKSWYTSDVLEECVQHESFVKSVESNQLGNLIISFRGQHFPELKRLGAHLKYAVVSSVSAYTKLIEDSLQEKENMKDEISNLHKKNYELCHQMVTAEKRLMDLKIQSEADLRAQEDVLTRHLKEISQHNEQKICEMRKLYELKRKEFTSLETVKAEQESQRSKGTRNAKSDNITQNVTNMGMDQQTSRHPTHNCAEGSALNGLQSTQEETKMKASNEPQPKRLKSSQAANSAGGDGISVIVTTNKGKRSSRVKAAETNNRRQNFNRRRRDKNLMLEQEDPQSKGSSKTKRVAGSNKNSRPALQQFRAKDSPSPDQLVDFTFIDSLLDSIEDQNYDPYAFDD